MKNSIAIVSIKRGNLFRWSCGIVAVISAIIFFTIKGFPQSPNGATIETRTFNDCPISIVSTTNNFPASIAITDTMSRLCFGFANLHSWSFSEDGGATSAPFQNDSNFRFAADLRIEGSGNGASGLRISPWYAKFSDGRFSVDTQTGEIACFGARLPFYSFTSDHGIIYSKGTAIRLEIAYLARGLSVAEPATIRFRVVYNGNIYDSPELAFDEGNPDEDPPYGLWGILNDARAGGFVEVRPTLAQDTEITANWSNITYTAFPVNVRFTIVPDAFNPNSRGRWVIGYIQPEPGHSVTDIDIASIRLNASVPVAAGSAAKIGDFDRDGVPDLELKFDRAAVASTLGSGSAVAMTVSGLIGGDPFVGEDQIHVLSH